MEDFGQGFLSEPFDEVRQSVRERYTKWHSLLLELNKANVALQHSFSITQDDTRSKLGAALFARTLASTQASILLLEHGLLPQSKAVLRSALESLFALCAISTNPEIAVTLARTHEANKRSLADKMLQWKGPLLTGSLPENTTEDDLQKIKENPTPELKTYQLAEAAGMLDWYFSMYALLSFPVHASVIDLASHLVTDSNGVVVALKNEPEVEGQESAWSYIAQIQISAASAAGTIFGITIPNITELEKTLRTLA